MDKDLLNKLFEDMPESFKKNKEQEKNDLWLPLFLAIFSASKPYEDIALKQEVAYLRGRLDVLEKVTFSTGGEL